MVSELSGVSSTCIALMGYDAFRDKWAKTVSANKDIKVYIGAPASEEAAGEGYVDIGTLAKYAKQAQETWSSFGGVMLWEASLAVGQCESTGACFLRVF